jgi:hypothetical protein
MFFREFAQQTRGLTTSQEPEFASQEPAKPTNSHRGPRTRIAKVILTDDESTSEAKVRIHDVCHFISARTKSVYVDEIHPAVVVIGVNDLKHCPDIGWPVLRLTDHVPHCVNLFFASQLECNVTEGCVLLVTSRHRLMVVLVQSGEKPLQDFCIWMHLASPLFSFSSELLQISFETQNGTRLRVETCLYLASILAQKSVNGARV